MTWIRLEEGFTEHPKIVAVGSAAAWLHVCAIAYSNRNLTDGCIPKGIVERLSDQRTWRELAVKLTTAGLWVDDGNCYLIHDYLDYQPSAVQVKETRAQTAERQRRLRARRAEGNAQVTPLHERA